MPAAHAHAAASAQRALRFGASSASIRGWRARVLAHIANARRDASARPRSRSDAASHDQRLGQRIVATTRVLDALHFRGKLRVARRANGIKVYALARAAATARIGPRHARSACCSAAARLYAPLPEHDAPPARAHGGVAELASPALRARTLEAFAQRARRRAHDRRRRRRWLRPADEDPLAAEIDERVRFLAPFDPLVWDRRRFEHFWGWEYRFEAYTPPAKRESATTRCRCCGATT